MPRSGVRTKRLLYVEMAARTTESVVRFQPWKTFCGGALRTAAEHGRSARRRENRMRLSEGLPASCASKKSWIDLVAMPCIRESAFVVEITPGSVVFPTYNAKADWDLGPQGRGAGLAACWEAPRSPVVPTKRDPFSDDRVYEFEQCITFG